jgi:hypothetical protein
MVFLEDPMPIIIIGIVAEALLGLALWSTGRIIFVWIMAGVLGLVVLGVFMERLIVTDRERIAAVLEGVRAGAQANSESRVLDHVAPAAAELRGHIRREFDLWEIVEVKIKSQEIQVDGQAHPPTAQADVSLLVEFRERHGGAQTQRLPVDAQVDFQWINDRWLITGVPEFKVLGEHYAGIATTKSPRKRDRSD